MKLLIATGNGGKLREIAGIMRGHECVPLPAGYEAPEENGASFIENARIKAKAALEALAAVEADAVIADDSGLCVEAMGGAPGIFSARYGGFGGDRERNDYLLRQMKGKTKRAAYFECAAVCVFPDGREITAEGRLYGAITLEPRGTGGFGYDPVFELENGLTAAEMPDKNEISHRGGAFRELRGRLEGLH